MQDMESNSMAKPQARGKSKFPKVLFITLFVILQIFMVCVIAGLTWYVVLTKPLVDSGIFNTVAWLELFYYEPIDKEKMWQGALDGMVNAVGDPYTNFFSKEDYERFQTIISGSYSGVGLVISSDEQDGSVVVVSPIEDTPAERAGLKTGDKIIKVDDVDVYGNQLDDAVSRMKGLEGTQVKLSVRKVDSEELTDVIIVRANIILQSVKSQMFDDIGYIRVTSFDEHTGTAFSEELNKMKSAQVKGLIVDLRGNPGGLLDIARDMADELLPEGVVVYTEDKNGIKNYYNSYKGYYDVPLVVLIDEGSASASEIFAGAMRDRGRATLVGQKSFGKGLVQTVIPVAGGMPRGAQPEQIDDGIAKGYLKLTVSQYFTPNGENIDKVGIVPDVVVEFEVDESYSDMSEGKDSQLRKALEILKNNP